MKDLQRYNHTWWHHLFTHNINIINPEMKWQFKPQSAFLFGEIKQFDVH